MVGVEGGVETGVWADVLGSKTAGPTFLGALSSILK